MPSLLLQSDERAHALERFRSTRSGREKPSRFWKYDLESLAIDETAADAAQGTVSFESTPARAIVCDLQTALREHGELVARAFRKAIEPERKFAWLTIAYSGLGAFIYVPADCSIDEPIVVRYGAAQGESIFPHTVVLAERGASVTIIERLDLASGAFACGIAEIVTAQGANVTYAAAQFAPQDARVIFTRAALPGRDARITWVTAELGGELAVADVVIGIEEPGVDARVASLFFPAATQHIDVMTTIDHRTGDATSETIVKAAANGSGQGRYLGNIRIAARAQHSNASLRDDSLLLSKRAHIDSIPALEIGANDVKAYHGATVGALDEDVIFYMMSRGIARSEADRMIALGFFEPVIDQFPTSALREELRVALQGKVE